MRSNTLSESLTVQGANASLLSDCDLLSDTTEQNLNTGDLDDNLLREKSGDSDDANSTDHALPQSHNEHIYGPSSGWCAQWQSLSYNIKLILIYTLLWGASTSIWNLQLLATYIYQITDDSTEILGFIEAIQGGAYLLSAIVAGILTDRSSARINIIRFSGLIGLFIVVPLGCTALLYVNTKYDDEHSKPMEKLLYKSIYYVWLFFYGICASFCNTILGTVFTDLIPKGKRDFIFSFQYFVRRMASTLGPLIIVAMFFFLGDHWKVYEMNIVLLSGIGLWCIPLIMLVFGFNADALQQVSKQNDKQEEIIQGAEVAEEEETGVDAKQDEKKESKYRNLVPWVMLAHRLIVAGGAGMTVKFFPIFFEDKLSLKPIPLNSIWIATPFATGIFTILVERCANKTSRLLAMILFKSFAIGCLLVMAMIPADKKYAAVIIINAYIVRTAAMNCAYPLEKAILMDYVDKKNRGKWNAIESVNATVWTLSAAAGGYLIAVLGYRDIYFVTASIYALGVLILIPLNFIAK